MKAKVLIKDVETGETLEEVGTINYDNTGRAIQNCETWYSEDIEAWEDKGYCVEITLVDL
jgi:hypothetical protein